jgi:hypothetical protein
VLWRVYGSPIPHSVIAKRVIVNTDSPDSLPARLEAQALWFVDGMSFGSWGGVWSAVTVAALAAGGLVFVRARRSGRVRELSLLGIYPAALFAAYLIGRAPREFPWYVVPAAFAWNACVGIGLATICSFTGRTRLYRAAATLGLVLVALTLLRGNLHALDRYARYQDMENRLRRRVGTWLHEHTPPAAVIAMEAIGYQGYYAKRRIVDLAGLASPEVVAIHRTQPDNASAIAKILEHLRPDYLVLRSFEVDDNHSFHGGPLFATDAQRAAFFEHYEECRRFSSGEPNHWGRAGSITVYQRRP